jgi:hypothetical protein
MERPGVTQFLSEADLMPPGNRPPPVPPTARRTTGKLPVIDLPPAAPAEPKAESKTEPKAADGNPTPTD